MTNGTPKFVMLLIEDLRSRDSSSITRSLRLSSYTRIDRTYYHSYHMPSLAHANLRSSVSYDPTRIVLIKQTYTVYVETAHGRRKWHLSTLLQCEMS